MLLSALGQELNLLLGVCGLIFLLGLGLKRIGQPYIIAYILTGVILGPYGFKLVTQYETVEIIGELGLVILMFFIGMEISLRDFISNWRVALLGTGMQILFSVLLMVLLGSFLDWSFARMLLLGFIISISSSAVVIKLVDENRLNNSFIGQNVISILITQDVLIVPMIIVISLMGSSGVSATQVTTQVVGGIMLILFLVVLLRKKVIKLPFEKHLRSDHELQIFWGLIVCFGLALVTSVLGLSAGLGAFVAGLFVHSSNSCTWLHNSLHSFRVVLVSIFFLSIGMLINIEFLVVNWPVIATLVVFIYLSNQGINAIALRLLGSSWKHSLYGGALLSQIGEFSFVLVSLGYHESMMSQYSYQLTIIVISITIFISPLWASFVKWATKTRTEDLLKQPKEPQPDLAA